MNKRIDKKKQKRTLESAVTATATSSAPATATPVVEIKEVVKEVKVPVEVPAKNPAEYTVAAITERVIADCNAKGHAVENPEALSIYLKPEDKKAYYTLGGFNGYIEL